MLDFLCDQTMKPVLLITANVGSLFDDTSNLRKNWLNKIVQTVRSSNPQFFALHLQEIGGKHFELYSQEVPKVINELYQLLRSDYSSCLALLDLDYNAVEEYTALGSVFFVHHSAYNSVKMYRFDDQLPSTPNFMSNGSVQQQTTVQHISQSQDQSRNASNDSTLRKSKFKRLRQNVLHMKQVLKITCKKIRKEKFPRELWPVVRWGRKGYMHTRWSVGGSYLDLINIHLFHDDSNLLSFQNPSLYSANRKKAMEFVLDRYTKYSSAENDNLLFIFGDFNFRLNAGSLLKKITSKTTQFNVENGPGSPGCSCDDSDPSLQPHPNNFPTLPNDCFKRQLSAIEFRRPEERDDYPYVLRIEKKRFDFYEPSHFTSNWQGFREDDQEPNAFSLKEARINFPPTYPWSEDPLDFGNLMNTRAPAWCDRILMNEVAWHHVSKDSKHVYNSVGQSVCMGDHKPVYLSFPLTSMSM